MNYVFFILLWAITAYAIWEGISRMRFCGPEQLWLYIPASVFLGLAALSAWP